MAVRLPLLLTGKPDRSPPATLAAPEGEELLVRVDPLADPLGEGARGEDVVGVRDDGDPEGGADHGGHRTR